ncbi:TRAM domain-containing protein [Saliphagus infecundisoli]|uniref:TRAM domain-containing protein n=1 Tax=Saliphagus infecundisoli TaxID=1849069 RepID=A0ABD5QE81_9EURY|nr:TRAM domain-containing protein [Saliphagus infecundisoli]
MEISENLLCLFSAEVDSRDDSYRIEVPAHELTVGDVEAGNVYRVALLESGESSPRETAEQSAKRDEQGPPITEGDRRTVDIEDIGKQGDGIARVERGYVIIVPETEIGDRVTIEIRNVQENLAFGEVIEHVEPTLHE